MFFNLTDSTFLTFYIWSNEICRWDVPAAAVIHLHKLLLRLRFNTFALLHFYIDFVFLIFNFIFSMDSFFIIHFKRLFLDFICLLFYSISDLIWFYSFIFLFMFITFIFTHSNFFRSRYNLDFIIWHCCPLLFKVDKICSYSYFIRNI